MNQDNKRQELERIGAMARSLLASMNTVIASIPDSRPVWHFSSYREYALRYNNLVNQVFQLEPGARHYLVHYGEEHLPKQGKTTSGLQHRIFQDIHANLSMLCAWIGTELGDERLASRVHALSDFLQATLRPAMLSGKPSREVEVQDTIERVLIGRSMQKGTDYDRETGRVKFAGKESIPDFVFQAMSLALEVKLVKDKNRVKSVVDEINADLVSYKMQYDHLIFVVYDNGFIDNEIEFKQDIESSGNVSVVVVKH